jgi:hypothetical protein
MKDPIDAFAWLLDAFKQFTRNQLTWREVRQTITEAQELHTRYDQHHRQDQVDLFAMALRDKLQHHSPLYDCTEEYLVRRLGLGRDDPLSAAMMCFVLWQRNGVN